MTRGLSRLGWHFKNSTLGERVQKWSTKERDEVSLKESSASRNRDGEVRWRDLRLSDWGLGLSEASNMGFRPGNGVKGTRFSKRREIGSAGHGQVELCVVGGMEGLEAVEYYLLITRL